MEMSCEVNVTGTVGFGSSSQSREMFEQQVMGEIRRLTTKIDELQQQVICVRQTLDDHLATCDLHPCRDLHPDLKQNKSTEIRRWKQASESHKQACLRKSLQMNIILLVDSLPFMESELGDLLISSDCLTEDECGDLRRCLPRKDQVRNLIRLIKGRSFKVMTKFLNCVNHISPDIARRIWTTYSENLKNLGTKDVCTFCSLRHSVDIKLLADHVWSIGMIPDVLYDEIAACPQPSEVHWLKLARECNRQDHAKRAMDVICEALEKKGHYNDLVQKLRRKTKLECCCFKQEVLLRVDTHAQPEVGEEDGDPSISPNSSIPGDFERSPLSDISSHEDLMEINEDVLNRSLGFHNDQGESLFAHRQGLRDFLNDWETNINLFRSRSNSFGKKSSAASRPPSQRRASMFN